LKQKTGSFAVCAWLSSFFNFAAHCYHPSRLELPPFHQGKHSYWPCSRQGDWLNGIKGTAWYVVYLQLSSLIFLSPKGSPFPTLSGWVVCHGDCWGCVHVGSSSTSASSGRRCDVSWEGREGWCLFPELIASITIKKPGLLTPSPPSSPPPLPPPSPRHQPRRS
jgi:hypothetical protein